MTETSDGVTVRPTESLTRAAYRRFVRHRLAIVGLFVVACFIAIAIAAPLITSYGPSELELSDARLPPSSVHPLGTDNLGYDIWSRLAYGARVSLLVGFGAVSFALMVGVIVGVIAGYFGGWIDQILGRLIDIFQTLPPFLLAVVLVAVIGPSLKTLIFVIAIVGWPDIARIARGQFLQWREAEFVVAARILGVSDPVLIAKHIGPNILGPVSVAATFGIAIAVLTESGLSFLGLGVRPPTPTWGGMISQARSVDVLQNLPWVWVSPAIAIVLVVLAVNFIGDGLRDAFDPETNLDG